MSESAPSPRSSICPTCGSPLSAAAGGMCPRCLMAEAAEPTRAPGSGASHAAPAREEVVAALPQFEIIEMIGAGGMGTVWRARQPKLHREVALKLLPASLADRDPAFAERFEREGQLLARLHHPNIVTVHDSGRAGDFFYLLMELVDGVNLRQAMRASRFTPTQALAIVPKICEALQYAHEEGVLHRDIKPENILLDNRGRVKLVDFGIAKVVALPDVASAGAGTPAADPALTRGDATLGTPHYMAPEQIAGPAAVDHRADIYSLGVVFYELLTGELPVGKFAPPSQKSAADPRLDGIVQQALEKERGRRQQSVDEMRTQMESVAGSAGSVAPPAAEPRFSRLAIAGAFWVPYFLAAAMFVASESRRARETFPDGYTLTASLLLFGGLAGCFGTTILGWVATTQIRRSAGMLFGLELAVFDLLLFPLLALDAGIWLSVGNLWRANLPEVSHAIGRWLAEHELIVPLVTLFVCLVLDWLIVRAVWRAIGAGTAAASRHEASPVFGYTAMFCAVSSAILGSWIWSRMLAPSPVLVWSILAAALLGVLLALPVRRQARGQQALLLGSINAAIWLILAISGVGNDKLVVRSTMDTVSTFGSVRAVGMTEAARDSAEPRPPYLGFGSAKETIGPAVGFTQAQVRGWVEKRWAAEYPGDTYQSMEWGEPQLIEPQGWIVIRCLYFVTFGFNRGHYFMGQRHYTFTKTGDFVRSDLVNGPEQEVPAPGWQPNAPLAIANGEAGKSVIAAQLQTAKAVLAEKEAAFQAGLVTAGEVLTAKEAVEVLEAELQGDPVLAAKVRLSAAGERLELAARQHAAGQLTDVDVQKAKGEVAVAEAKLRETEAVANLTASAAVKANDPPAPAPVSAADTPSAVLGPIIERTVGDIETNPVFSALSFDSGNLMSVPPKITLASLMDHAKDEATMAWASEFHVDAVGFVTSDAVGRDTSGKLILSGLLCPGVLVRQVSDPQKVWDNFTPADLKAAFDKAMHEWNTNPKVSEIATVGQFPANYLILDTRTHRRGVLQLVGLGERPNSVKIRYRLVEEAAQKSGAREAEPARDKYVVTKEQAARIEALLKKGAVTTDHLAALFEQDGTSGSSYRRRADVVSNEIMPAEKSSRDFIPYGVVHWVQGGGAFYVQWDGMGASTYHYYGPFYPGGEVATALGPISKTK